ncbi:UNVERIFIED_ORG: hypothetical protein CLV66_11398 [Actinomadura viridilutea]
MPGRADRFSSRGAPLAPSARARDHHSDLVSLHTTVGPASACEDSTTDCRVLHQPASMRCSLGTALRNVWPNGAHTCAQLDDAKAASLITANEAPEADSGRSPFTDHGCHQHGPSRHGFHQHERHFQRSRSDDHPRAGHSAANTFRDGTHPTRDVQRKRVHPQTRPGRRARRSRQPPPPDLDRPTASYANRRRCGARGENTTPNTAPCPPARSTEMVSNAADRMTIRAGHSAANTFRDGTHRTSTSIGDGAPTRPTWTDALQGPVSHRSRIWTTPLRPTPPAGRGGAGGANTTPNTAPC